jgi:hypothetical protein
MSAAVIENLLLFALVAVSLLPFLLVLAVVSALAIEVRRQAR